MTRRKDEFSQSVFVNCPFDASYIVRAIRDWFVETVGLRHIPSATRIWRRFTDFTSDFYDDRVADGFSDDDLNMMPVPEYIDFIQAWWRR
ncbi:MAG TPA: hypothetical protein VF381_14500 [Thermoanaerobaculia bacterium]